MIFISAFLYTKKNYLFLKEDTKKGSYILYIGSENKMGNVLIIGAGIGGLCTAVRLLKKGFNVTIIEKEFSVGGKINLDGNEEFKFDLTASIMMTPDIYLEVLKDMKEKDLELIKLEPIYSVHYYDGTSYKFSSEITRMNQELRKIDVNLPSQYEKFLFNTLKNYIEIKENYLDAPMIKLRELFKLNKIKEMIAMQIDKNCYDYISKFIDNEKFKEYLLFQAMYMGINPYENSAIYSVIPAICHGFGLCHIKGGMYKYILELEKYIDILGGKFVKGTKVNKIIIKDNRVIGVKTSQGIYQGDMVVCNADFPYAMENLFEEKLAEGSYSLEKIKDKRNSYAVFIIYLGLSKKYSNLTVHNIFINKNLRESLNDTDNGGLPMNPSLYIYYPSAVDVSFCKEGKSVMNIMVRVPNLQANKINWDREKTLFFRNVIMEAVKNIKGLEDIEEFIEYENFLTPVDLQRRFNAYNGSAFGLSHKLSQSLYFRPPMKSKKIKGLYYIGSSTHPGNGTSIIIGGTRVLAKIIEDDSSYN